MNATLTRVNGIFNKDLAVRLILITNNDLIIYTNAVTDPYSDATAGAGGAWSQELQDNLTTVVQMGGLLGICLVLQVAVEMQDVSVAYV
jgi:hypothetical protein